VDITKPEKDIVTKPKSGDKPRRNWQGIFSILMYVYMYLPILVLALYSFNESRFSATWGGFSFKWYQQLFNDDRILAALRNSLVVGLAAVAISAVFGTLMAVGLARYRFPGKGLYKGVSSLPLIIPDIALAVSTLVFLAVVQVQLSLWTIVAAHVVFCLSYVGLVVSTRLADLDPHLEEAALDLGATPFQAFIQVLLPQLIPGIISGCMLAFVVSLDDFLIASFTAGSGVNTLPMEIFSRIRTGVRPDINALSVMIIVGSGIVAFIAEIIRNQSEKRND
jgi:spermidine/putrescine transport system permease protein